MNETQAEKKRQKILEKLKDYYMEWLQNYKVPSDRKQAEKLKQKREKIEAKKEELWKELFALDAAFPPKSDYSKDPKYINTLFVPVPKKFQKEEKAVETQHKAPSAPSAAKPAAKPATAAAAPTVSPAPKKSAAPKAPVKNGPSIPAGNRYAAHEQLISKIAREIVSYCTEKTEPAKWYKGASRIRIVHGYKVEIQSGGIKISSLQPDPRGGRYIGFVEYDMKSIPDIRAFREAVFPLADAYFSDRIRAQFAHSSIHVKPTLHNRFDQNDSIFYLEVQEHHDADDSLKSW